MRCLTSACRRPQLKCDPGGTPTIERRADPMSEYSIGIDDHYAWANLVSVTTSGPNDVLLDKRRVELLDQQLTASPYHHETLQMRLTGAEKLVRDVKTSANKRAKLALSSLIGELAPAKRRGIAIRVPPLPDLPATVAEVHANTWIMNRADGMIYHQALTQAAARLNLRVFYFEKDNVLELAAQARGKTARDLQRQRSCCCLRRCDLRARIRRALETQDTTAKGPRVARCPARFFICGSTALRPRALRPQVKRGP